MSTEGSNQETEMKNQEQRKPVKLGGSVFTAFCHDLFSIGYDDDIAVLEEAQAHFKNSEISMFHIQQTRRSFVKGVYDQRS